MAHDKQQTKKEVVMNDNSNAIRRCAESIAGVHSIVKRMTSANVTHDVRNADVILDSIERKLNYIDARICELRSRASESLGEGSIFCGEPNWPYNKIAFRVEFSLSSGHVIVDPLGRESVLGYVKRETAEDVAKKMNIAFWMGALETIDYLVKR